ncbi:MAG: amidohydrolase [Candidatus Dadabacteria bacterium]|nr:MAG: amidohydrolase [Candidatus Dadabacteria bacterium]
MRTRHPRLRSGARGSQAAAGSRGRPPRGARARRNGRADLGGRRDRHSRRAESRFLSPSGAALLAARRGAAVSRSRPWLQGLSARAAALSEALAGWRRAIHRQPEIGLRTPRTQALVIGELERLGADRLRAGSRATWVAADIPGRLGTSGQTVALRADMDALPVCERAEVEFRSAVEGTMHACGHDAHTAMLLGAAHLLASARDSFAGTVRLLFEAGEEGCGGARVMIEEGALEGVQAAFALHVDPGRPPGTVASRPGTFLAGFDDFEVTFEGSGGHASTPHATRDPIPAIGPFVDGLSHVAAREADPDDRVVLSVTMVRAGEARNVIAPRAWCAGTIRFLSRAGAELARDRLERVAAGVAAARGVTATVEFEPGYPPTVNDSRVVERLASVAADLGLRYETMPSPYMGAEDFSYLLERCRGAMAFLGCRMEGTGPLHSDRLLVDERALPLGAALYAAMALDLLAAQD